MDESNEWNESSESIVSSESSESNELNESNKSNESKLSCSMLLAGRPLFRSEFPRILSVSSYIVIRFELRFSK